MSLERVSQCTPSTKIKYDPSSYKVVFFSSAPIWSPFLDIIANDSKFNLVGVVTMPDAPAGRWMKMQPNPIKTHAQQLGLKESNIQTPRSLQLTSPKFGKQAQEFHDRLNDLEPDFIVVIAYGKIIPQTILDIPHVAPINVHGSLLPLYRGASPLQTVFLDNQLKTGVTIMVMNAKLDEGDILSKKEFEIPLDWTAKELIEKMKEVWPLLLIKTLRAYGKWHIEAKPQDHSLATFSSKIDKSDGMVDPFHDSLETIYNKRRAYILRPKLTFSHLGKNILIEKIAVDAERYQLQKHEPLLHNSLELNKSVSSLFVKPDGKKTITREEYLRGYVK